MPLKKYRHTEIISEELVPKAGPTIGTNRIRIWFDSDQPDLYDGDNNYTDLTWEQLDRIHSLAKPN